MIVDAGDRILQVSFSTPGKMVVFRLFNLNLTKSIAISFWNRVRSANNYFIVKTFYKYK